ncbi:MAG: hypothetical protein JXN64_05120 [Spirochaetes bacterium]|nr:hypothetical protein [Spirochaetota bacterium]
MEIQINNCPVNFELHNEKTVGDVVNAIVDWTQHRNLIFTETAINSNCYSIDKLPDISLDDVETLNCFVQSKADVVISSLNDAADYCAKVQAFFNEAITTGKIDVDEIENASAGIEWIIEILNKNSELLDINFNEIKYKDDTVFSHIGKFIEFRNGINSNKKDIDKLLIFVNKEKDIFSVIDGIFKMILMSDNMRSLAIQSIDSPDVLLNTLINIKKEIPAQIKILEEIAVLYQTRTDDSGARKLDFFINFIFNYSRTCFQISPVFGVDPEKIVIDGVPLSDKNNEIQNHLNNITDAMENNDIVNLSDILEYEMKSSLENLEIYIDMLIDFVKRNA